MYICKVQDDNKTVCNKIVSKKQWDQDGMCSRCASLLWSNYVEPLLKNQRSQAIVFNKEVKHG